jgi:WD40 repeat protein
MTSPSAGVHTLPGGQLLFSKDNGGDEWFQLFLRGPDGQDVQLTEPGTRNDSPAWSKDGSVLVWARATKGSGDADILMRDPSAPGGAKVIFKGEGAISPEAVSPDGKTVLLGRYYSINESKRWLLDVATGKLTPLGAGKAKVAYSGGTSSPPTARACCCCRTRGATSCAWSRSTWPPAPRLSSPAPTARGTSRISPCPTTAGS